MDKAEFEDKAIFRQKWKCGAYPGADGDDILSSHKAGAAGWLLSLIAATKKQTDEYQLNQSSLYTPIT